MVTYCAQQDRVFRWIVRHIEHRKLGTTRNIQTKRENRKGIRTKEAINPTAPVHLVFTHTLIAL